MHYRDVLPTDLDNIVSIHVTSSQQAYAHILPASYLRDVMPGEKRRLWCDRLESGFDRSKLSITVAEEEGEAVGFACFQLDDETEFGTYLHNIYVAGDYQRRGVASGLLVAGIASFEDDRCERPVHLRVFAQNAPARAFYKRLGGKVIERLQTRRHGNDPIELCRYQWLSAKHLRRNAAYQIDGRFQRPTSET